MDFKAIRKTIKQYNRAVKDYNKLMGQGEVRISKYREDKWAKKAQDLAKEVKYATMPMVMSSAVLLQDQDKQARKLLKATEGKDFRWNLNKFLNLKTD